MERNNGGKRLMKQNPYLTTGNKIYLTILYCVNIFLLLFSTVHILFQLSNSEYIPTYIREFLYLISFYLPVYDFVFLIPSFVVIFIIIISEVVGICKSALRRKETIVFFSMNLVTIILLVTRVIWWLNMLEEYRMTLYS